MIRQKTYYIGHCINAKTGHPYTISLDDESAVMDRMQSYCDFWGITKFSIYKVTKTPYAFVEEVGNG